MADNITGSPENYISPKNEVLGSLDGTNKNIGIICAKFNETITKSLLMGAISGFTKHGVNENSITTHWVPGAFEIPVTIAKNLKKFNGFIALGCVIKGQTPHFDFISKSTTDALMTLSITSKKPVGNGVITCLSKKQAVERGKKGSEAAEAVLSVLFQ